MTTKEIKILDSIVSDLESGKLTKKEKLLFVMGIQGGLYVDNDVVKSLVIRVIDSCLDNDIGRIESFNN